MSCGWEGEHCQAEWLEQEIARLEEQRATLINMVFRWGNLEDINIARGMIGKSPVKIIRRISR